MEKNESQNILNIIEVNNELSIEELTQLYDYNITVEEINVRIPS